MLSWPDFSYKQIAVHITEGTNERLRFRADNIIMENDEGQILCQHSCHRLFALFIIGDTSITSVAIRNSIRFAFPIVLMNHNLKFVTSINCTAEGNTILRRIQYTATNDHCLEISRQLVKQKIQNQIRLFNLLRYKSHEDLEAINALSNIAVDEAQTPKELLGMEGYASKSFFSVYFRNMNWNRREPRCKRDIANLLLDIGYTYLFNFMDAMLSLYGFDKYCGVYHTFFYQRKSLVCDIIEPFRCIIDRRLRKAFNLKQINQDDFFVKNQQVNLKYDKQAKYTGLFLKDILQEKENIFKYCQQFYRWTMQKKDISKFPVFTIQDKSGE